MEKINHLRTHLLQAMPDVQAENLHIFVEQGSVYSTAGTANPHYQLRYPVTLIFTHYVGDAGLIFAHLVHWLARHEPNHASDPALHFNADILNHTDVDLSLTVQLTETVKVQLAADGSIQSTHACATPDLNSL